jgi:hypothetical protein
MKGRLHKKLFKHGLCVKRLLQNKDDVKKVARCAKDHFVRPLFKDVQSYRTTPLGYLNTFNDFPKGGERNAKRRRQDQDSSPLSILRASFLMFIPPSW